MSLSGTKFSQTLRIIFDFFARAYKLYVVFSGDITSILWAPQPLPTGNVFMLISFSTPNSTSVFQVSDGVRMLNTCCFFF